MSKPEIISATGISFGMLNYLLGAQNWYAADQETVKLMLSMSRCTGEAELNPGGVEAIAVEDLQLLDQLWLRHSYGKFGLSPQRSLWRQFGQPQRAREHWQDESWQDFWQSLTWPLGRDWFRTPKISFAQGQLPFLMWHVSGSRFQQHGKTWQAYRAEFQKTAQLMEMLFARQDW